MLNLMFRQERAYDKAVSSPAAARRALLSSILACSQACHTPCSQETRAETAHSASCILEVFRSGTSASLMECKEFAAELLLLLLLLLLLFCSLTGGGGASPPEL